MEAASGFEPENNGFAGRCLTPWPSRHILWSGKRDLNPRLRPWQGRTLPLSYSRSANKRDLYTPALNLSISNLTYQNLKRKKFSGLDKIIKPRPHCKYQCPVKKKLANGTKINTQIIVMQG